LHLADDLKTFLVFPYMDHDLCGLLKNPDLQITDGLIKLYILQLLEGVAYMHHVRFLLRLRGDSSPYLLSLE
jgi:serine/threonine protein kinase